MRLTAPVGGKCKIIGGFWYPEYLASQMYGNVLVERKSELRSLHLIFITFPPLWGGLGENQTLPPSFSGSDFNLQPGRYARLMNIDLLNWFNGLLRLFTATLNALSRFPRLGIVGFGTQDFVQSVRGQLDKFCNIFTHPTYIHPALRYSLISPVFTQASFIHSAHLYSLGPPIFTYSSCNHSAPLYSLSPPTFTQASYIHSSRL